MPYNDDDGYPPELTRDEALAEQAEEHEMVEDLAREREMQRWTAQWHWHLATPERVA